MFLICNLEQKAEYDIEDIKDTKCSYIKNFLLKVNLMSYRPLLSIKPKAGDANNIFFLLKPAIGN